MDRKVSEQSRDEMARQNGNLGVVFLLGFLAVGIGALYVMRPTSTKVEVPVQEAPSEAKTSPPTTEPVPEETPPTEIVPTAPPVVQPATPPASTPAVVPVPPPVESANSFVARHEAAWGRACIGRLSLTPGFLIFQCPGRTAIILPKEALMHDRNGVREIAGGRAYHFVVAGKSRAEMRTMFEAWAGR